VANATCVCMFKFLHPVEIYRSKQVVCVGHFNVVGGSGDKWEPRVRARSGFFFFFALARSDAWWQTAVHDLPPCFGRRECVHARIRNGEQRRAYPRMMTRASVP
jgi:hypothetical protein